MNPKERIQELTKIIKEADYNYNTLDNPTITDQEYDSLMDELIRLERVIYFRGKISRICGS